MAESRTVQELSVVLPAYNEASVIAETVINVAAGLRGRIPRFEIIVVDDGSVDGTSAVLEKLSGQVQELRIIRHRVNRGYGAAVRSGLLAAREPWLFFMDSDGQFTIDDLPSLLERAGERSMVIGYRQQRSDRRYRRVNAWMWGSLIHVLFGFRVRDLDCAFKLFPQSLLSEAQLYAQGAFINVELLAYAKKRGYAIIEVPVRHFPRTRGMATGAQARVILRAFRELVNHYLKHS